MDWTEEEKSDFKYDSSPINKKEEPKNSNDEWTDEEIHDFKTGN